MTAAKMHLNGTEVPLSPVPAPVVYFDHAPSVDHTHGVIGITLATVGYLPNGNDVAAVPAASVAAHLKCSFQAAIELRNAIDSALLLAQPAVNQARRC